jgi:hypothetical protein
LDDTLQVPNDWNEDVVHQQDLDNLVSTTDTRFPSVNPDQIDDTVAEKNRVKEDAMHGLGWPRVARWPALSVFRSESVLPGAA